jgi:hypothetical protein
MNQAETNRFDELYEAHVGLLKLQGKSQKTMDAYADPSVGLFSRPPKWNN